jgi:hypothetical protein
MAKKIRTNTEKDGGNSEGDGADDKGSHKGHA